MIKLKKIRNETKSIDNDHVIQIEINFENKTGKKYENIETINMNNNKCNDNNKGIGKGILLCKYFELLKQWISSESCDNNNDDNINNINDRLRINNKYKTIFREFAKYFKKEMTLCIDDNLQKELDVINLLFK